MRKFDTTDSFTLLDSFGEGRCGILIYEFSGGSDAVSRLVVRGAGTRDIVGYTAQYAPEIYQCLTFAMKRGSIYLDLESAAAWRRESIDTAPDTMKLLEAVSTFAAFPDNDTGFDSAETVSIVLCGGKGTRMQSKDLHKVCFPIAGRPAVNRLLERLESAGVGHHIVVVGDKGAQVVQEVSEVRDNVTFVYQIHQNGTGNAAKQAAYVLSAAEYAGNVLVVPGDKVIEQSALDRLTCAFADRNADLAFMTADKSYWPDSGRVVYNRNGRPLDIVEKSEIVKMSLAHQIRDIAETSEYLTVDTIKKEIRKAVPAEKKARTMFPALFDMFDRKEPLTTAAVKSSVPASMTTYSLNDGDTINAISGERLEKTAADSNASVYLFRAEVLYDSVFALAADNAQNEEYLTDVVRILAADRKADRNVITVQAQDYHEVMAFNNPEELLKIEEYYNEKESGENGYSCFPVAGQGGALHSVGTWLKMINEFSPHVRKTFSAIYGTNKDILYERREAYLIALEKFVKVYGKNNDVIIVRSPGRVNMMGRHIEHRGGYTNYLTINREMLLVAGIRDDDVIEIHNVDARRFRPRKFSIGVEAAKLPWDEWFTMLESDTVTKMIRNSRGDWSNYFKAAALRLQEKCRERALKGFNGVLSGSIPLAAGLSSSSAVVVSAVEAITNINGLSFVHKEFVDICGEGEWFVGTRGGSGDHAAMKFGEKGNIIHMKFCDVGVENVIPFPNGFRVAVLQSHEYAQKSADAMQIFNEKVATYEVAHEIVRHVFPEFRGRLPYFRDINTEHLGLKPYEIYDILLAVPERITRKELLSLLDPDACERLKRIFSSHREPAGGYQARNVALFGLAEIARAREFSLLAASGAIEEAAMIMNISHDGDRITCRNEYGNRVPFVNDATDCAVRKLRDRLRDGNPSAKLYRQPGRYECSTALIDEMVDTALDVEGVLGAQLSGAGLGGCIMALITNDAVEQFTAHMTQNFYKRHDLIPKIYFITPIAGSGIVTA